MVISARPNQELVVKVAPYQPVMDDTGNGSWQEVAHSEVREFDPELRPLMSPKIFLFEREDYSL